MKYYVTTSIPYVNGEPHIGFGMELVQADALARFARQNGHEVIYATGTDEHGTKVAERAETLGLDVKDFTDKMSKNFRDLDKLLNISNDRFVRTTDNGHEQRAQLIWKNLEKDIYKSKYTGWYCVGCEAFVTEATAKENKGSCPTHQKPYERIEEENYFFRLSSYAEQIKSHINDETFKIIPKNKVNEILNVIDDGLEDISISRPKEKISWGVPVPGDAEQVMYVWFEALMNYITVLGYPEHEDFEAYWPADVQVIGKDILRFHAAIWPGMLLSLGLPLPKKLYVHGFITVSGEKISKSLGNGVHPKEIVDKYGIDTFRYFFLRHIPSQSDGNFSWDKLEEAYNNELANELGNAVQRTAAMITQYQDGLIGTTEQATHDTAQFVQAMNECRFDKALDEVWEQVRGLNQYIDEAKPWEVKKRGDNEHLKEILSYQVGCLLEIADLLEPFMPDTSKKIKDAFKDGVVRPIEGTLFPKHESVANK